MKDMKNLAYILGALTCAIILSSCDTRDDWFKDNCEEVYFYFVCPDGRIDTVDGQKPHMLEYTTRVREVNTAIHLDTISFQTYCETIGERKLIKPDSIYQTGKYSWNFTHVGGFRIICEYIFNRDNYTTFLGAGESNDIQLFDSDTTAKQIGKVTYIGKYSDAFGNQYTIMIKLNVIGNIPPIPVIEVSGDGMERTINLKQSYDKDGSISKYEICIDGNIVEYSKNDNRYEEFNARWVSSKLVAPDQYWQGGKAAYGGTYITATSINVFNHVFQEPGKHTIYYRCMDNEGAWSTWKEKTIEISKQD